MVAILAQHALRQPPGPEPALSYVQAISTLLALEGFLLAVVSLTVSLGAADQKRQRDMLLSPRMVARLAAGLAVVVASGAVASWCGLYAGGHLRPLPEVFVATALLVAIVMQPFFAVALSFSLKFKK